MNQANHEWLNETPFDDDAWIEMLVDGELNTSQRTAFIKHIKQTDNWQRVATAFLDDQVLQGSVGFDEPAATVPKTSKIVRPKSFRTPVFLLVASLLLGGLVGFFARQPETVTITNVISPESIDGPEDEVSGATSDRNRAPSLPTLMQASNTPSEAVYYSDFSVPQFLLDALMIAGHEVELAQDFISQPNASDPAGLVPVNVIRVRKYQNLLASASLPRP
ncbi:MAG: hypothetical protein AB8G99_17500 [Planctomycetaceae bacterium]